MQVVIPREHSLIRECDPDSIWPPDSILIDDMSAIALVYIESGFVIAADGRIRCTDNNNPLSKLLPSKDIWEEQKIFREVFYGTDVALAITGSTVIDYYRSYNLFTTLRRAMREVSDIPTPSDTFMKVSNLASSLYSLILKLQQQGIVSFVNRPTTIGHIFIVGYFGRNSKPTMAAITLSHENGELLEPEILMRHPPTQIDELVGSPEIRARYLDQDEHDKRFLRHFHPKGPSLDDGREYTTGFIEACKDELAATVDSDIPDRIGGHIHAAAVTPSGFQWLIEPACK